MADPRLVRNTLPIALGCIYNFESIYFRKFEISQWPSTHTKGSSEESGGIKTPFIAMPFLMKSLCWAGSRNRWTSRKSCCPRTKSNCVATIFSSYKKLRKSSTGTFLNVAGEGSMPPCRCPAFETNAEEKVVEL